MDAVIPLCHVRSEPAMEIAVAETRDLFLERDTKPGFEAAPEAQLSGDGRVVHDERKEHEGEERSDDAGAIFGEAEKRRELEKRSKQKRLDDDCGSGAEQPRDQGCRREETILADPLPQLECGPSWGFVSRRFESFGQ